VIGLGITQDPYDGNKLKAYLSLSPNMFAGTSAEITDIESIPTISNSYTCADGPTPGGEATVTPIWS
jgi:hypothetical protein